ncbi:thiopurine S-methyltransferase [Methylomonas rhizoryzae]|uniref:thiopurine S-methyltransferase n=1 Tax=Methylomonas rhizoryzae TaxID=2608981 RepID=UPI00123267BB|nr:thiopurine S-methyltransferase [Methylomonas rhizoryzae]
MEKHFWLERWQQNQIGFHNPDINPHLTACWPGLNCPAGATVFVPFCGKSNDMLWLTAQGYRVIGVEISELAVKAFFSENGLCPAVKTTDALSEYRYGDLVIFCGDFFQLDPKQLANIDAVYDRASLVALPTKMRPAYVEKLTQLLQTGTRILLVSFDYPQHEMQGPPFSVPAEEIHGLYAEWCNIEFVYSSDLLAADARFRERGLSYMHEQIYRISVL